LNSRTPVLSLQNGLGNVETLCSLIGSANLLAGVSTEAVTLLDEGKVRHVASGVTRFGAWTSCPSGPAVKALTAAGFNVDLTESPGQVIWEKVAINAGINPVTALVNVKNGLLLEAPELRQLMRDLVVEAVKVAATEGYRFENSIVEVAEKTCAETAENISSMLQDVRAGRTTEIDALSGEIVRRAQLSALPTPRTRVVWQLVKGIERR
jgi:2-dehydropantoate 2-reductase